MRFLLVTGLLLASVGAARADDFDDRCKVIQDYAIKQLRAGRGDRVKPYLPSIEACRDRAKAQLAVELQKLIERYNATKAEGRNSL